MAEKRTRRKLTLADRLAVLDAKIVKAEDYVLALKGKRAELIENEKARATKMWRLRSLPRP